MVRGKDFYKEIEDELAVIESGATMEEVNAADASVQQSLTMQRGRVQVKITRLETELKKAQEEMAKIDKQIATKKVGTGIQ